MASAHPLILAERCGKPKRSPMKPDEAGCTTLNWEIQSLTAGVPGEVATQMGNRGYSTDAIRVAREMVCAGEIGDVTEVHAWHGGAVGALEIASGRRGRGRSGSRRQHHRHRSMLEQNAHQSQRDDRW